MKVRNGFVSNSSSSSFIIIGEKNIGKLHGVVFTELVAEQKTKMLESENLDGVDVNERMYLTEFISDSVNLPEGEGVICYADGAHMGPFDEDEYEEILDSIWIHQCDIVYPHRIKMAKEMLKVLDMTGVVLGEDQDGETCLIDTKDDGRIYKIKKEN